MSFQKMMDRLEERIDARFDEIERLLKENPMRFVERPEPPQPPPAPIESLGLPSQQEAALVESGYTTVDQLAAASDDELAAVDGVGKRTIEFIRGRAG